MVNFLAALTWPLALGGIMSNNEGDLIWVCGKPPVDYLERTHALHLPARDKHNQILRRETVESNTVHLFHHNPPRSVGDFVTGMFASREDLAALCYCGGSVTSAGIGQCVVNRDYTLEVKCVLNDPSTYSGGCRYFRARWGH